VLPLAQSAKSVHNSSFHLAMMLGHMKVPRSADVTLGFSVTGLAICKGSTRGHCRNMRSESPVTTGSLHGHCRNGSLVRRLALPQHEAMGLRPMDSLWPLPQRGAGLMRRRYSTVPPTTTLGSPGCPFLNSPL
jgi:hypothetical protein